MSKVKYYYDPESLTYKVAESQKFRKLKQGVLFLTAAIICGALVALMVFRFVESPKEKQMKRELGNMVLNYELLNKKMTEVQKILEEVRQRDNNIYRVYFETNPIPIEQRKAGFGGVNRYRHLEGFENSDMIKESVRRMDILTKELYIQSKSLDEIVALAEDKSRLLEAIPAIQPVQKQDLTRIASGYGMRKDPFTKARKKHYGMDFSAPRGTPVYASGSGKVIRADNRASGFGKHIRIDHGYGYVTLYAHLDKYNVRVNQKVKRGDLIGFVGSTGRSKGPHLHYEVHKDRRRINPINFYYGNLTPEEFEEMRKVSAQENQSLD